MKKTLKLNFAGIAILSFISIVGFRLITTQFVNQDLQGVWISVDDSKWIWEFTSDGKILDYYSGTLVDTYSYSFEKTSPQCGKTVDVGPLFEYLRITNINDTQDIQCYEILSKDEEILQIRPFGRGGSITFQKSNNTIEEPGGDIDFGDGDQQFY